MFSQGLFFNYLKSGVPYAQSKSFLGWAGDTLSYKKIRKKKKKKKKLDDVLAFVGRDQIDVASDPLLEKETHLKE